jgi:hypothetical protein
MAEDETFPFPRRHRQPEKVAHENTVGPRVGEHQDPTIGRFEIPDGETLPRGPHSSFGQEHRRIEMYSIDEIANGLTALQSSPSFLGRASTLLGIGGIGALSRSSVPQRISDLLQPIMDDRRRIDTDGLQERSRCLSSAYERRHDDLVPNLTTKSFGDAMGLPVTPFGQRRVVNIELIAHPFGFTMSYKYDLHDSSVRRQ